MPSEDIERDFPALLDSGYEITSEIDDSYNCIAWAVGVHDAWWDPTPYPGYYWPDGIPRQATVDALVALFRRLGFVPCGTDASFDEAFEKVAIYGSAERYEHAARQTSDGKWTSKLGPDEDISHSDLRGLVSDEYGELMYVLRRERLPP